MSIVDLQIENYRSIRDLWIKPKRVNVIVGANGSGKSNFYKALRLIAATAEGRFAKYIATEGGMASILWAGARGKGPAQLRFRLTLETGLRYQLICGLPIKSEDARTPFPMDPEVKEEDLTYTNDGANVQLLNRKHTVAHARDEKGKRITIPSAAPVTESVISQLAEPQLFPELFALRQEFLNWRFYHQFRTDELSPLRQPQVATLTHSIAHDGHDVAAALQTIDWIGAQSELRDAVAKAFSGAVLAFDSDGIRTSVLLQSREFTRAFQSMELSDGTLKYLCLLAAMLSTRPPKVLALNEPETGLFKQLLKPLAEMIALASRESQVWVVTHSFELADYICELCDIEPLEFYREHGATKIKGIGLIPQ